jgi:hypothetical protein
MQLQTFANTMTAVLQDEGRSLRRASNRDLTILDGVLQAMLGWVQKEMQRRGL